MESDRIRQIVLQNNELAWVGTYGGGLYKVQDSVWQKIGPPFVGEYILCLKQDSHGGLWVGTARNGAYYYYQDSWEHFSIKQGFIGKNVWDIFIENNETIWFCNRYKGVCKKFLDTITCLSTEQGLPDRKVTVAINDTKGKIWFGTVHGGLCSYKNRQFQYLNTRNGLSGNYIRALICDSILRWVGSWDGGLDYFTGEQWERINEIKQPVVFLGFDGNNNLWVGTWGHGVYAKRSHNWENLTKDNSGLPSNYIIDIDFAENGTIYFATSKGVAVYSP